MNYQKNILVVFNRATPTEITSGIYWYDKAKETAIALSYDFDIPVETACLVISALSPNNNWTRNLSDAWKVCRFWKQSNLLFDSVTPEGQGKRQAFRANCVTCTYPANKQKAFDILDGLRSELGGMKTANFARNLNGCLESVTVDVHAFSIANAKRFKAKTMKPISKKTYEAIADAYRLVARELDIAPAHLQAIVWQTWRRIHGLTTHAELTGKLFD